MPYSATITHDIDFITKYKFPRNILGSIKRGESPISAIRNYRKSKQNRKFDPYYCMEEMLDVNNSYKLNTIFFFMAGATNYTYDLNDYNVSDTDVLTTLNFLIKNGATIGLHPSYESYNNFEILKTEKAKLEDAVGFEVIHTRQHYLRYDLDTFRLLALAGFKFDSTIGPQKKIEFNDTFNKDYVIYDDNKHVLVEQPFLMMDTHMLDSPTKMLEDLNNAVVILKKNGGCARVIWHNNNFETKEQKSIYKEMLSILAI